MRIPRAYLHLMLCDRVRQHEVTRELILAQVVGSVKMNTRLVVTVIVSAISIGVLLQLALMRVDAVGVDWIAAVLGLAAVGILVMAAFMYHHELCHVPLKKEKIP